MEPGPEESHPVFCIRSGIESIEIQRRYTDRSEEVASTYIILNSSEYAISSVRIQATDLKVLHLVVVTRRSWA